MAVTIPKWESELWSLVSGGDGAHCPLRSLCQMSPKCAYCLADNAERLSLAIDDSRFSFSNYEFFKGGARARIFELVEMLAKEYLKRGMIDSPPTPTNLAFLADEQHTIGIHILPLSVYHGAAWHLGGKWIIQLREDDPSSRKRFTLFHEAFHILAHSRMSSTYKRKGITQGSFNELLANLFASKILMPREWIEEKWTEVRDLERMAEIFNVPKPAMYLRLRRLGFI